MTTQDPRDTISIPGDFGSIEEFVLTDVAQRRLVVKHDKHFLILDDFGSIPSKNKQGYGYYLYDTRHLSRWEITLNNAPLVLLSTALEEGYAGRFIYSNPQTTDMHQQETCVHRRIALNEHLVEELTIENFKTEPLDANLVFRFDSDFEDIFSIRGFKKAPKGKIHDPEYDRQTNTLMLSYTGIDERTIQTRIKFLNHAPSDVRKSRVAFDFTLPACSKTKLEMCVIADDGSYPDGSEKKEETHTFWPVLEELNRGYKSWAEGACKIKTSHDVLNLALERCFRDVYILRQPTPKGVGIAAGIPWYSTVFGRDSAILGLQILPFVPSVSRECIEVLANYQGKKTNKFKGEEPGKIMHEIRQGELARAGIVPHNPYYGTVDATQLWLILLSKYTSWTGDIEFATGLWENVELALDWLDRKTNGFSEFITYQRDLPTDLENQGWKDSDDSIMHLDGSLAKPPIALCEPQAYIYRALKETAKLSRLIERPMIGVALEAKASHFKKLFLEKFWMEDEEFVALAVDGNGDLVRSLSSNAGHCIWSLILDESKAHKVADKLMSPEFFSGWGIRTLTKKAKSYKPISYHNGSIWPHDNAIIADGIRRLGRMDDVHEIMTGLCLAGRQNPDLRLPELFCGFTRRGDYKPVDYPVACSPQAWATGSIFHLLQACLGLKPSVRTNILRIIKPALPEWLDRLRIENMHVGKSILDLTFTREYDSTHCHITNKRGDITVLIEV